jgi:hypothetical protein
MSKLAKQQRKAKKEANTLPKLMKLLENIKIRVLTPRPGTAFRSIKDYNRNNNKKIAKDGLDDV